MVKHSDLRSIFIRLEELNEKIDNNSKMLNDILKLLRNDVTKNCKKMNEHIEFVENVYDAIKNPLSYICNSINGNTILPSNEKILEIKNGNAEKEDDEEEEEEEKNKKINYETKL